MDLGPGRLVHNQNANFANILGISNTGINQDMYSIENKLDRMVNEMLQNDDHGSSVPDSEFLPSI